MTSTADAVVWFGIVWRTASTALLCVCFFSQARPQGATQRVVVVAVLPFRWPPLPLSVSCTHSLSLRHVCFACTRYAQEILVLGMLWQLVKKQVTRNISLKTNPQIVRALCGVLVLQSCVAGVVG